MKYYGIWMDHAHAYFMSANESEIISFEEILSDMEANHHSGLQGDEKLILTSQKKNESHRENEMHKYAQDLISRMKDADRIYVFGPGEAKHKFEKELRKSSLSEKILAVETSDKMTENQLKAKVQEVFGIE